jgi:hypothetical protein
MLIEITNYFALPGLAEAVLAQRRHATAVRVSLGLPPGSTFRRIEEAGPDVRWECAFNTREDYERDLAVRGASDEFARARKSMHLLVARFERHLQERVDELT